VLIDPIKY